jgi:methionyl-tRNA synthetase
MPQGKVDTEVQAEIELDLKTIREGLDGYEFKKITDAMISLASFGNRYLQAGEPWKTMNSDPEKAEQTIYNCLWLAKAIAVVMEAVMPAKANALWIQLCGEPRGDTPLVAALIPPKSGIKLGKPTPLFEQVQEEDIEQFNHTVSMRIEEAKG